MLPEALQKHILSFVPKDKHMKSPIAEEINNIIQSFNKSRSILLYPYKTFHDVHTFQFKHIFYRYALRYNHYMKCKRKLCDGA